MSYFREIMNDLQSELYEVRCQMDTADMCNMVILTDIEDDLLRQIKMVNKALTEGESYDK